MNENRRPGSLLLLLILLCAFRSGAQQSVLCGTMQADSLRRTLHPFMGSYNYAQPDTVTPQPSPATANMGVVTIPVIVHVIHSGEAVGVERNISQAQVHSQIPVLNEDFRRMLGTPGWNDHPAGADIEIEFCLAEVDPQGNYLPERGIHRVHSDSIPGAGAPPYISNQVDEDIKPATSWDPNRYYNVWVVDLFDLGGFAQFPDSSGLPGLDVQGGPANTDGVAVHYRYFGRAPANPFSNPRNQGRLGSHETGHFFGLRHVWGDEGACGGSDYCEDTPLCSSPGNNSTADTTCEQYLSCDNIRMIENYMDYSADRCYNIFTNDQKARMRHVLDVSPRRRELPASNVCHAPPACNITRTADPVEGGTVTFHPPYDGGYATTYQWSFEGGSPAVSTDANPVVQYAHYGVYDVTITITNANGSCTTTHHDLVTVYPVSNCDTLAYPPAGTPHVYTHSAGGYACGWNVAADVSKAEFFSDPSPYTDISGGLIDVSHVNDNGNGALLRCRIWKNDGAAGSPGTIAGEVVLPLADLETALPAGGKLEVQFPVSVPVTGDFYFGFTMENFGAGDTLGAWSSTHGDASPSSAWEERSAAAGGGWHSFTSSRNLDISMFARPFVTNAAARPVITLPPHACQGTPVPFDASSSQRCSALLWTFPGGNPATSAAPAPQVEYAAPGEYAVYLDGVGTECHSLNRDSALIMIHGNPSLTVATQEPSCFGESDAEALFTIARQAFDSTPPPTSFDFIMYVVDSIELPLFTYIGENVTLPIGQAVLGLPAGDYSAMVVDAYGCAAQLTFVIGQPDELYVNTGYAPYTCMAHPNGSATAIPGGGTPPYSYLWNDRLQQSTATAGELTNGVYQVIVTDANGCATIRTVNVPAGLPFCPTISTTKLISPDADGENDVWLISGLENHPGATVNVYNALGQLVFASTGYAQPWSGVSLHGDPLPPAVYYYLITEGGAILSSGPVMLVRE